MATPEDTSKRDPLLHLAGAMSDGLSGYIEGMEAAGQRQLVNSDRLPTDCGSREGMEALGFEFGAPDPDDPMFMPATLPDGWHRKGSDHAMWSHIVDERGLERVAIFYKAAVYDRSAHMALVNVGGDLARKAIYGDDDPDVPWSLLTEEESSDVVTACEQMRAEADRSPTVYGKYLPRIDVILASRPNSPSR